MDLDQDEALEAAQKRVKEGKEYVVDRPRAILWPNLPRSIDQSDEATDIGQTHFASDGYGVEIWDHGRWSGEGDYGRVLRKEVHLARFE